MENVSGRVIILHFNIIVISGSEQLKEKKSTTYFSLITYNVHAHSDVIIKITVYIGFLLHLAENRDQ